MHLPFHYTSWLEDVVKGDEKGFVLTGIFAAGDVRRGSIKRVASSVGEGAMAVQLIHRYLG